MIILNLTASVQDNVDSILANNKMNPQQTASFLQTMIAVDAAIYTLMATTDVCLEKALWSMSSSLESIRLIHMTNSHEKIMEAIFQAQSQLKMEADAAAAEVLKNVGRKSNG